MPSFVTPRFVRHAALLASVLALSSALAAPLARIPVAVHVVASARSDADAGTDEAFVAAQLADAQSIFGALGVELVLVERRALSARHAELRTRADRDALARYARRGVLHWFVVETLMDVDEPGRVRRGVHWHERAAPHRHFVVTSKIAGPYVLAHELGHYFGNPAHSPNAGNLMSYERGEGPPTLDEAQQHNVRDTLARMLSTRELVPLASPTRR